MTTENTNSSIESLKAYFEQTRARVRCLLKGADGTGAANTLDCLAAHYMRMNPSCSAEEASSQAVLVFNLNKSLNTITVDGISVQMDCSVYDYVDSVSDSEAVITAASLGEDTGIDFLRGSIRVVGAHSGYTYYVVPDNLSEVLEGKGSVIALCERLSVWQYPVLDLATRKFMQNGGGFGKNYAWSELVRAIAVASAF